MKANSFHSTDTIQNKEAGNAATQNTNEASFKFRESTNQPKDPLS